VHLLFPKSRDGQMPPLAPSSGRPCAYVVYCELSWACNWS